MVDQIANRMTLTLASDREVSITRTFDAPRALVFEAMTGCEHMMNWWGPRGYALTECEIDLRPGGAYRFVQRSPDGGTHPFKGVYREIAAPGRIVFTQIYDVAPVNEHEVVVTNILSEQDGRTTLSQHLLFDSLESRDGMIGSGMERGEAESFDRLDELLAQLRRGGAAGAGAAGAAVGPEFASEHDVDAPRDLVWKAWTEPDRLARWWGPAGFEMRVRSLDLRPGGVFHYSIRPPNGREMWGRFVYREVVPQERIVFVNSFSDANCGVTRNPWIAGWPLEVLNTLTLSEHDGKTKLTLRGGPINASEE